MPWSGRGRPYRRVHERNPACARTRRIRFSHPAESIGNTRPARSPQFMQLIGLLPCALGWTMLTALFKLVAMYLGWL